MLLLANFILLFLKWLFLVLICIALFFVIPIVVGYGTYLILNKVFEDHDGNDEFSFTIALWTFGIEIVVAIVAAIHTWVH